ncbi:MAG: DUF2167 domain-containing protein [Phycisphaerales bacterium]|nr:DUF2167 domain-containing protein [Phycisphaerales bacterium]
MCFLTRATMGGIAAIAVLGMSSAALAQQNLPPEIASLPWQKGPCTGTMSDICELKVKKGMMFVPDRAARKALQEFGNLTDDSEMGLVGPLDLDWFVVFEWDDIGYVKDDGAKDLDERKMMEELKRGSEAGNRARREAGLGEMRLLGWAMPPTYDAKNNSLVWATRFQTDGGEVVNYFARRLGRKGVARVTLVCDPEDLEKVLPKYEDMMKGFTFTSGQKYAEWKPGDKVAAVGLAALVTGGAAAVAVKTGLFAVLLKSIGKAWKLVVAGIIGVGAIIGKVVMGRRS